MNSTGIVPRVVAILQDNGYETLPGGVKIGSLNFEFGAVLSGSDRSSDLIIVADTVSDKALTTLRRTVLAVARALDVIASRRSLTLVVAGPRPSDLHLRELSRVCRVLLVGTPTGLEADGRIRDSLAILLPLTLAQQGRDPILPFGQVHERLLAGDGAVASYFFEAASQGAEEVQLALRAHLLNASEKS